MSPYYSYSEKCGGVCAFYEYSDSCLKKRLCRSDSAAVENHVEVYIGFLRKKLMSINSDLRICTARRMGYHLEINHT